MRESVGGSGGDRGYIPPSLQPEAWPVTGRQAGGSRRCRSINFTRLCFVENTESRLPVWIWGWDLDPPSAPYGTDTGLLLASHIQFSKHDTTIHMYTCGGDIWFQGCCPLSDVCRYAANSENDPHFTKHRLLNTCGAFQSRMNPESFLLVKPGSLSCFIRLTVT